jgi:phosphatidylserine/phosphatidylglycerophosphate/cardiolipin synthase-like enzyme
MIIDAAKVISGSYNFSAAAYKRNTENLLIIRNAPLAKDYIQNWQGRWDVSK